MKSRKNELEEIIDVVIKLAWNYTIFRALFEKNDTDCETRKAHPEFFLTMHDSLLCEFCLATTILFDDKVKATSFWNLIKKSTPELANKLTEKIQLSSSYVKKVEALRHQVFAHRWEAKSPQNVFTEVRLRADMMTEVVNLAQFVICELADEITKGRKEELQRQQLSQSTLQSISIEVAQLMQHGFR